VAMGAQKTPKKSNNIALYIFRIIPAAGACSDEKRSAN
jgi:hypothetical protein